MLSSGWLSLETRKIGHRLRASYVYAPTKEIKKSNIRHRRNRYKFEIIRRVIINITSAKEILRNYHIKYVNDRYCQFHSSYWPQN
jgi:hypothetical protein